MTPFSKLTLHHCPMTRSARAKWALHETVGEAFEVEYVDLYKGAQYAPSYVAKNPNHNVPMLEIEFADGEAMRMLESVAIVAFLADAFPDKRLAPPPGATRARAEYLKMLHFGGAPMDMMLWQIRIHEHVLPPSERDARTIARYRGKFKAEVEPQLAARLSETAFICGDDFSAADCVIGMNVVWARAYDLCTDDVFKAYLARLARRPAFRATIADAKSVALEAPALTERSPFNG